MNDLVRVLVLKDGRVLVSKVRAAQDNQIGEPDCVMIDPVLYNEKETLPQALSRFPGKHLTDVTEMEIHSDNILVFVKPTNKLLSEYLVAISD